MSTSIILIVALISISVIIGIGIGSHHASKYVLPIVRRESERRGFQQGIQSMKRTEQGTTFYKLENNYPDKI